MRNLDEIKTAYERGEGSIWELAQKIGAAKRTLFRRASKEKWQKRTPIPESPVVIIQCVGERRTVPLLSVRAYAAIHGCVMAPTEAKENDRLAEALCRELGIVMGCTEDELFGVVNTYPLEVLNEVLGNDIAKGNSL